jgi:hypothetical protein
MNVSASCRRNVAAALLALAGSAAAVGPAPAEAETRLFAADSVWNAPLRDHVRLDRTHGRRVRALRREITREIATNTGPAISDLQYSTPLYVVPADQRRVGVSLQTGNWGRPLQHVFDAGVPVPADAQPARGTDGHMTVYQPATDTLWELIHARRSGDAWLADWGGAMRRVSRSPGYYSRSAWPRLQGLQGWNWGATASSLPVVGGTILIDELRRGRIDHALAVSLPDTCRGVFAFPAQRTDGASSDANCVPMGARLRLDPRLDLSKLPLSAPERTIARAAQRYGMIVRDRTGHGLSLYAEDAGAAGQQTYRGPDSVYGDTPAWKLLRAGFPWDRLQLVSMRLCRKAPCLPR